jgi:hypothetical protein
MLSETEGFPTQVDQRLAPPPAKKTAGQIEKETVKNYVQFIRGFRIYSPSTP